MLSAIDVLRKMIFLFFLFDVKSVSKILIVLYFDFDFYYQMDKTCFEKVHQYVLRR